jgi:PAS domain S-box-containing protein
MASDARISKMVTIVAGALAAAASILPPAFYLSVSYQRELGSLEAEAEVNARLLSRIVTANPDLWRFEQERFAEFLTRRPRGQIAERRRILDATGNVVAESSDELPQPLISAAVPLLDSSAPVGRLEISRSLRPALLRAAFLALVLLPVAFLAFQMLRVVPLRALRRSERALRRQRDAAQRYLDVAGVAVVLLDARGHVALVNKKGAEILARPVEDVVGKDWVGSFVASGDRDRVGAELARLSRSDRVLTLEYPVVRPTGERRIMSWYMTPVGSPEGGPAALLGSGVDLTTQRQLEEQLRHAQKMEAVGMLAGGVAHGFNNILAIVKGYASQLRNELPHGDPHLPDIDEILAASDRGAALTRSLLTFSQRKLVSPEPTDVPQVVREAEQLLQALAGDAIEVDTSLAGEPLRAMVGPLQIEQVLIDLVANARDAMPGGGRISISVVRADLDAEAARREGVDRPGAYVRVSVADTGSGIAGDVQPRVFEPFFTTKGVDRGAGLGLATVYGIMKQHRGVISVVSEPGKGSTFAFLLPLLDERDRATPGGEPTRARAGSSTGEEPIVPQDRGSTAGRRDA